MYFSVDYLDSCYLLLFASLINFIIRKKLTIVSVINNIVIKPDNIDYFEFNLNYIIKLIRYLHHRYLLKRQSKLERFEILKIQLNNSTLSVFLISNIEQVLYKNYK